MISAVVSVLIAVYIGIFLIAFAIQDKMVFPAGGSLWRTPDSFGWPYEEIRLPVQGKTTHAWFIPCPDSRGVVLFSHGNGGTMSDRLEVASVFRKLGLDVLLYDYGGYGASTGRPSETRCYADARAMWDFLTREKGIPPDRIVLFGESLGGGVAVDLAAERTPGAVILMSTFLSAVRVGQEAFPFLPVRLFLRHRFNNEDKIGHVTAPVLIIHGPDDEIVSFRHGERLFELANEPKEFLRIHGGHNDGFFLSETMIADALKRFLDAHVAGEAGPTGAPSGDTTE